MPPIASDNIPKIINGIVKSAPTKQSNFAPSESVATESQPMFALKSDTSGRIKLRIAKPHIKTASAEIIAIPNCPFFDFILKYNLCC